MVVLQVENGQGVEEITAGQKDFDFILRGCSAEELEEGKFSCKHTQSLQQATYKVRKL